FLAGNPAAGCASCAQDRDATSGRRRDLTVESHARLQCNQRALDDDELGEGFVELSCLGLEQVFMDFDSGSAQPLKAFAADQRIRIAHGGKDAGDTGANEFIDAWTGASDVGAWFEIDVERSALCLVASLFKGDNLRMLAVLICMKSLADEASA